MPLFWIIAGLLTAGGAAYFSPQVAGYITTPFVYLFGFLLGTVGMLFDEVIKYTIINFSESVFSPVEPGINVVWTALRALGNIGIIGIFVFIAISMILGLQSFGSRKLVARVLIIAVLINFSLFFTRIIIEGSNLIAKQFYNAALSQTAQPISSVSTQTTTIYCVKYNFSNDTPPCARTQSQCQTLATRQNTAGYSISASGCQPTAATPEQLNQLTDVTAQSNLPTQGISGQFMQLTGLSTAFAEGGLLTKLSNSSNAGYMVLVIGAFTAILILITAVVFAYAIFLLVTRTVLFLFLLISSPLAFAVYLYPKLGQQYWSMWWNALIRNALFAPLLLMFLWATLTIGRALVDGLQRGSSVRSASLVDLFSNPTQGSGTLALFIFILIIGMLLASIRFASIFSRNIAGFNLTGGILASPLAMGLGYGVAPLLRNTLGRLAYERKIGIDEKMKELRNSSLEPRQLQSQLARLGRQSNKAEAASRREYNPMSSFGGRQFRDVTGLGNSVFGGATQTGGYAKKVEESSRKIAERFESAVRTTEEKRGILAEAAKSIDTHEDVKAARGSVDTSQQRVADVKKVRDEEIRIQRDTARRLIEDVQKQSQSAIEEQRKLVQEAAQELRTASGPAAAVARRKMDSAQAQEQSLMRSRDDVIQRASQQAEQRVRDIEAGHSSSIDEAEKRFQEAVKEHAETRQRVGEQIMQQAEKDIKGYDEVLEKAIRKQAPDRTIARSAAKRLRTNVEDKSLKRLLSGFVNENNQQSRTTAAPISTPLQDRKAPSPPASSDPDRLAA